MTNGTDTSAAEELGYLRGKVEGFETRMENFEENMSSGISEIKDLVKEHSDEARLSNKAILHTVANLSEDNEERDEKQDGRLKELEDFNLKASTTVRTVRWLGIGLLGFFTASLGDVGTAIMKWFN